MENRKKLCCTCGQILPMEKFPKKIVGHRREAECEDCIKNRPLVRKRSIILGKSPRPPRLGKMHLTPDVVVIEGDNPRQLFENKRATEIWDNRLRKFAMNRDWFTVKDAKEEIQYSMPIARSILNTLSTLGYLEKKSDHRVKQYRIKKNELITHKEAGLILE